MIEQIKFCFICDAVEHPFIEYPVGTQVLRICLRCENERVWKMLQQTILEQGKSTPPTQPMEQNELHHRQAVLN